MHAKHECITHVHANLQKKSAFNASMNKIHCTKKLHTHKIRNLKTQTQKIHAQRNFIHTQTSYTHKTKIHKIHCTKKLHTHKIHNLKTQTQKIHR